jgi:hypothetical protein
MSTAFVKEFYKKAIIDRASKEELKSLLDQNKDNITELKYKKLQVLIKNYNKAMKVIDKFLNENHKLKNVKHYFTPDIFGYVYVVIETVLKENEDKLVFKGKKKETKVKKNRESNLIETEDINHSKVRVLSKDSILLITSAQNNTPVHKKLFNNLLVYKEYLERTTKRNVEIVVIPFRYKNPTSVFLDKEYEKWDTSLYPYLFMSKQLINDYYILGDVKVQPTAQDPLSNLTQLGVGNNVILAHTKQHLKMIPNSLGPKIAVTTGAITVINYTDSKIGKQGEFNHIFGFIYLDVKNRTLRAISAEKNGNFQDVNVYLSDGDVKHNKIVGMVLGDIHYGKENKTVYYNSIKFASEYKIQNIVLHDIFDGESISHHHDHLLLKRYFKAKNSFTVKDELDMVVNKLIELYDLLKYDKKIYIVRSNHDEHLDKWINRGFANVDLNNLEHFADIIAQMIKNKKIDGALELYVKNELTKLKRTDILKDLIFVNRRQPVKIKGWLISEHGDQGVNGVRGSLSQYKKLSDKIIVGHSHVPMRYNNVVYVGCVCDKNADYLKGISTWEYANAIILENGKVQHIFNNT